MRHDIERVHDAIQQRRKDARTGDLGTADHGDFVLVHAFYEKWIPKVDGDWVCLYLSPHHEAGLCQVVALSSSMPLGQTILREINHGLRAEWSGKSGWWPSDLGSWRSDLYDVLPVEHGPCLSRLFPLVLKIDVLRPGPIDFTLVCDKIPMPEAP
jgi:hypothetical protein